MPTNTSKINFGQFNKILLLRMAQDSLNPGFNGKFPFIIAKKDWPARSSNLNLLNFSIWSILEDRVSTTPHLSLASLHAKLLKEWKAIPQEHMRVTCDAFVGRLKAVIRNKRSYIK